MRDALYADAGRALAAVPINVGFARAVVEGVAPGELWADRDRDARAFHAVHPCGMSLVWGPDVAAAVDDVVGHLRARAAAGTGEWLQVEPRWDALDWAGMLRAVPLEEYEGEYEGEEPPGAVLRTRVNFAFDPTAFSASAARAARAPGPADGVARHVRPATAADFAWAGSTVPNRFWPDAAAFLSHGGGWVVEVAGTPAAIAFCSFRGDDDVEIGIETLAEFRRRGLATVAAAAMIADLVERGLTPVWSCRADNVGSVRLAEALGFVPSRRLPYFQLLPGAR